MADVGGVAVAVDVGGPFVLCGVGVAGADVAGGEEFELLVGAEFICLWGCVRGVGGEYIQIERRGGERREGGGEGGWGGGAGDVP